MPIYQLTDDLIFPPVDEAEDGVVAIGGDLLPERLMIAYRSGIFPWFNEDEPPTWYSPDPRCVIFPDRINVSRSMRSVMKKAEYLVTFNKDFEAVIGHCKETPRVGQDGTWISDEMEMAYIRLHELGHAESVEVWKEGQLVGGMYGINLGAVFSGESMFSHASNASKVALISFMNRFKEGGGKLFDCQVRSEHLMSLGAEEISRNDFVGFLEA